MEKQVSAQLIVFADSLNPSKEFIAEGKELVETVLQSLQMCKAYDISRKYYGGSVGKQTSVIYPDFDCVVFVNNQEPPFDNILNEFKYFIEAGTETLNISLENGGPKKSWITLSFNFLNGVEVDLLPASNFSSDPWKQWEAVREKVKLYPEKGPLYGSSLAEIQLDFLKRQSGFTHQLIRLTKYWLKSLTLKDYVYGGSAMMEMICVAVMLQQSQQPTMLQAFKLVMGKFQNLNVLKIAFMRSTFQKEGTWRLATEDELKPPSDYFNSVILHRKMFIIEPANPYNDFASNLTPAVITQLQKCATDMLQRLVDLEVSQNLEDKLVKLDGKKIAKIHFNRLFQPFPMVITEEYPETERMMPILVLYHYSYHYPSNLPKTIARHSRTKDIVGTNKLKVERIVKILKNNVQVTLRNLVTPSPTAFTKGLPNLASVKEVKTAVEQLLSSNFDQVSIKNSTSKSEHENSEVTFFIPYKSNSINYAVQISLIWNPDLWNLCVCT